MSIDLSKIDFPKYAHSAIICGQTGCGKTEFVLDLLESEYAGVFDKIVILCPTIKWNKAYKNRKWIGDVQWPKDKNITIVNPVSKDGHEMLQELLRFFFNKNAGSPTLYIIDDCSATKELTKKKDMLSELAFSGRHAEQSVWVISQRYISVLKDLREQTKWLCLCASVYMCFVVTCWERADLFALVCGVFCEFVTFPLVSWVRCGT